MFESVYILASVVSLCSYVMLSLQDQPRPCSENWPVLAVMWDLGMVQPSVSITKYLNVFYDQVYSIRYVESIWVEYGHMTDIVIWLARLFWEPVKYPKIAFHWQIDSFSLSLFTVWNVVKLHTHKYTSQGSLCQNCGHSVRSLGTIPSVNQVWCALLKTYIPCIEASLHWWMFVHKYYSLTQCLAEKTGSSGLR